MEVHHHEAVVAVIVHQAGIHQAGVEEIHLQDAILLQKEMTEVHLPEEIAEVHPCQNVEAVPQVKGEEVLLQEAGVLHLCHVKK